MIYIYINKHSGKVRVFGSIKAFCDVFGLKKDRFYTHFGRNKNKEFENEDIRIVRLQIERSSN